MTRKSKRRSNEGTPSTSSGTLVTETNCGYLDDGSASVEMERVAPLRGIAATLWALVVVVYYVVCRQSAFEYLSIILQRFRGH